LKPLARFAGGGDPGTQSMPHFDPKAPGTDMETIGWSGSQFRQGV